VMIPPTPFHCCQRRFLIFSFIFQEKKLNPKINKSNLTE
jgi:hypothetical protein